MIPALEALTRLRDGNRRFTAERRTSGSYLTEARRTEVAEGQNPFAIILGCSDSRVPAELVFDQGLGDLFVIRVAGNIVAPSQVGSVEFAASRYGTRLVVRVRPSVETVLASGPILDPEALVRAAVRANVRASAEHLRRGSALLEALIQRDGLLVVGAEYSLETGVVNFF